MTVNKDGIKPVLNKDYAEWVEHNGTMILSIKVRRIKSKSSVENSVGTLEKCFSIIRRNGSTSALNSLMQIYGRNWMN